MKVGPLFHEHSDKEEGLLLVRFLKGTKRAKNRKVHAVLSVPNGLWTILTSRIPNHRRQESRVFEPKYSPSHMIRMSEDSPIFASGGYSSFN